MPLRPSWTGCSHVSRMKVELTETPWAFCGGDAGTGENKSTACQDIYPIPYKVRFRCFTTWYYLLSDSINRIHCDPNVPGQYDRTPLHCAAAFVHLHIVTKVHYGGPEVQKTRFWNPSLTTFRLIRRSQKWRLRYYLRSPGAVTDHSVRSANTYVRSANAHVRYVFEDQTQRLRAKHECSETELSVRRPKSVFTLWTWAIADRAWAFAERTQRLHSNGKCSQTEYSVHWPNMSVCRPNLEFTVQT